jgi:hypothetical protein
MCARLLPLPTIALQSQSIPDWVPVATLTENNARRENTTPP